MTLSKTNTQKFFHFILCIVSSFASACTFFRCNNAYACRREHVYMSMYVYASGDEHIYMGVWAYA